MNISPLSTIIYYLNFLGNVEVNKKRKQATKTSKKEEKTKRKERKKAKIVKNTKTIEYQTGIELDGQGEKRKKMKKIKKCSQYGDIGHNICTCMSLLKASC